MNPSSPGPFAPAPQAPHTVHMPEPDPDVPMVVRMVMDPLFPADPPPPQPGQAPQPPPRDEPIAWVVSKPHPFVNAMRVMRMFNVGNGVEIYSISNDGMVGTRTFIPESRIRLVEEAMPLHVFADELEEAERGDDDLPDDPDDPEPQPEPQPGPGGPGTVPDLTNGNPSPRPS